MIKVKDLFKYLPSTQKLEQGLGEIFSKYSGQPKQVLVLNRTKNIESSTHPSEIIQCVIDDNGPTEVFIKYEIGPYSTLNDHRKNIAYETNVYKEILLPINMSTPKYYGSYTFPGVDINMLVIEFIPNLIKVSKGPYPTTIINAAKWIAGFHNKSKIILEDRVPQFLHIYDREFYAQGALNTINTIENSKNNDQYKWLIKLVYKYLDLIPSLLLPFPAIIHGEFYPTNVRYSQDSIRPVDWQTTAIGSPLIDLATLIENWEEDIQKQCILAYNSVSLSNDPLQINSKKFLMVELFLCFLWLKFYPNTLKRENKYLIRLKRIESEL